MVDTHNHACDICGFVDDLRCSGAGVLRRGGVEVTKLVKLKGASVAWGLGLRSREEESAETAESAARAVLSSTSPLQFCLGLTTQIFILVRELVRKRSESTLPRSESKVTWEPVTWLSRDIVDASSHSTQRSLADLTLANYSMSLDALPLELVDAVVALLVIDARSQQDMRLAPYASISAT